MIQYHKDYGWLKRAFENEEELLTLSFIMTRPEEFRFQTYTADPYSDDYSNLDLEQAREARQAAEYEELEAALYVQELLDGGGNHYDDDGRFHLIDRQEMGYED